MKAAVLHRLGEVRRSFFAGPFFPFLNFPSSSELYVLVSSEKQQEYPAEVRDFQKPGTGVWSIDYFHAATVDELDPKRNLARLLESHDPAYLHFKDCSPLSSHSPGAHQRDLSILFCTHTFSWASGTTGLASFTQGKDKSLQLKGEAQPDVFPRGPAWDVAVSRITGQLRLPAVGVLSGRPNVSLYFYDGAECFREHQENERAKKRKRGFCCEELGGAAYSFDSAERQNLPFVRLSRLAPSFVSPFGTGCSRYHSALQLSTGAILTLWQQGQEDGSQSLVGNWVDEKRLHQLLSTK